MSYTTNKLEELQKRLPYFELVSLNSPEGTWLIRNCTDEGLVGGAIKFYDDNLDRLIDRANKFLINGPDDTQKKTGQELELMFGKKVKMNGDSIGILYDYINGIEEDIKRVEDMIQNMKWKYKGFHLDLEFEDQRGNNA